MASNVRIIGLSGTNGSGKDAIGLLLSQKHSFLFISVTDLLRQELQRRGMPIERSNLSALSAEWRREFGMGVLIDRAIAMYNDTPGEYAGLAISSLRNPFEADHIHELGGTVVWVDAEPHIRYERIRTAKRQGRQGEDGKTYEQFLAEEQREMFQSGDEATLNMSAARDKADLTISNNSSDLSLLDQHVTEALGLR